MKKELLKKCKKIKVVLTDVDSVLTDGGMYYTECGDEIKKFNVRDGAGVVLLKASGILVGAMTGESSLLVTRRMKKMGMQFVLTGSRNKKDALVKFLSKHKYRQEDVAYIGDEINDFCLFGHLGVSFAVKDACDAIKEKVDYVLSTSGGQGALREVAELILTARGEYASSMDKYLSDIECSGNDTGGSGGYDNIEEPHFSND